MYCFIQLLFKEKKGEASRNISPCQSHKEIFLECSLWEPGGIPAGKAHKSVFYPKIVASRFLTLKVVHNSASSNLSKFSFKCSLPVSGSSGFCSIDADLGYDSLDLPFSPYLRMEVFSENSVLWWVWEKSFIQLFVVIVVRTRVSNSKPFTCQSWN